MRSPFDALKPFTFKKSEALPHGTFITTSDQTSIALNKAAKTKEIDKATDKKAKTMCPIIRSKCGTQTIPQYSTYVSLRNNILAMNEESRTYLPYMGDDFNRKGKEGYSSLESDILEERDAHEGACGLSERSRLWLPYASDLVSRAGCTPNDVVEFLSDANSTSAHPQDLPEELVPSWRSYQGAYADELIRLSKESAGQWRSTQRSGGVSDRKMVAACVANQAFKNITGFSLFHVFKHTYLSKQNTPDENSTKDLQARVFDTYTRLECLVCGM